MKNALKLIGIIALIAVIGFSMVACGDNGDPTGTGGTYTVTYNGNTNTSGAVPTDGTSYPSGATVTVLGNNGNLAKTGNTFAGWNTAANGSGASYNAGSTFTIYANTTLYAQWTPNSMLTIDGIWSNPSGSVKVTVSGSTGILTAYPSTIGGLSQSAIEKGYVIIGTTQYWRNLTSSGNLTWSGQHLTINYYTSSPDVAIGTTYNNCTFTLSADGQTLSVTGSTSGGGSYTDTWTRNQ